MTKSNIIILLLSLLCFSAIAQNSKVPSLKRTLIGVVKDEAGKGLPGAVVYVKGHETIGTETDKYGNFTLQNIPEGNQTLIFSMLGMEEVEIAYTGQESTVVTLKEEAASLDDVVVTGIITRHRNSFTGSASTFSGQELKIIGNSNILQSLKTLEPSMNIVENNLRGADPNTMPDLEIRGKTSIVGELSSDYENVPNQPLFILDGMEVTIETIMNLNIDRVKSVTVLKDAASTAIYGSKAANGVIVVETIPPEPGQLRVSYSGNFGIQFPDLSDYNLMNAEEKLTFERLAGRYTSKSENESPEQDALDALYYSRLKAVRQGVDSYWLAEPLRTVFNHSHNLYIDGGDQNMQYGIGVNYGNEKGVMKGSDRDIVGGNIQVRYRKGRFTFSNNFNMSLVNSSTEPVSFSQFANANPYYRKRNPDGSVPLLLEDIDVAGQSIYNPLALFNIPNTNDNNDLTFSDQMDLTWRFWNAFTIKGTFGISNNSSESEAFQSPDHPDFIGSLADKKGLYSTSKTNNFSYNGRIVFSYGKLFGAYHNFSANAAWDFSSKDTKRTGYSVTGFVGNQHRNPEFSSGFNQGDKPEYSTTTSRSTGFLLSANYAFKSRYMFDFNYRLDGSSVFGAQRMFTGTWSAGIAWDISNEAWFKVKWIDYLKLRYSAGNPGNQNFDAYMSSGIYEYNPDYTNIFGESAIIQKVANRDLAWQKTLDQNWGLDFTAWDDRIRLGVDYYYKNTDPLLVSISLPPSAGQTRVYTNLGGQISQGFSGTFNVVALRTQTMRLGVNFTFAQNKSKYVNIGDQLEFMNEKGSSEVLRRYYDGASPDDIWAVRSLGIDPATGREIFLTKEGEYTFQYDADDEVKVGSTAPDLEGIIGVSFYWGQFSAAINCRYEFGGQIFASALYDKVENISEEELYYNVDRRALYDRWQKPGDNASFKAIDNLDSTPMSSRFVLDNNVFTLESISVGYDTSARWLQKIRVQGASIRLYANNIWRIASVKEERGIEYPFSNSISMSISLRF